jgi:transcriptional regulator with XRE-family HTH domain
VAKGWKVLVRQIAQTIRERRLALDISQVDLARRASVSRRRIQQLEAAEEDSNASLAVLFRISQVLDLEINDLLAPPQRPRSRNLRASKKATD